MNLNFEKIKESFPFVSHLRSEDGSDYYGIILNADKSSLTFIDINKIHHQQEFLQLMKIAQNWWWYSNRIIPLNLFYNHEVTPFMDYVTHLPFKTTDIVTGHISSLQKMLDKSNTSRKNRTLSILD